MSRLLIIGYGNPLRGDDGVGWRVAEALRDVFSASDVKIFTMHQLVPELAEPISEADHTIFIDAGADGVAGRIMVSVVQPEDSPRSSHHHLTPEVLLSMASSLYGRCPSGILYTITGSSFEFSQELSETVKAVLPYVLKKIKIFAREMEFEPSRLPLPINQSQSQ